MTEVASVANELVGIVIGYVAAPVLDRLQQGKAVAASNTSWHVMAGNGSVSTGAFKPAAQNPNPCFVVVVVDTSNQFMGCGGTIIPLPVLDIDTVMDFYSR